MGTGEKAKAEIERVAGRVVKKTAHAMGKETLAAKGAALEARGNARRVKEKGKDALF
ncbi:hypothetical protein OHB36_36135 [Streptomyces sp. NBC_00320]|uniref:hypothetical protein n=1 Tax=unclassified Streptomyces TaxID=2593676 RepID=UPI00225353D6|nr:hypothetical protein [Streptomyces sp. NBC_00320]MCX5152114.1 hypothetical protein [Streptomyces sp. NBC_00320]